ncbi:MAG: hypothetical protein AAF939_20475 [Planctomycetota bacterium]
MPNASFGLYPYPSKYLQRLSNSSRSTWDAHIGGATAVAVSPNGQWLASGSGNGELRVLDLSNNKIVHRFAFKNPKTGLTHQLTSIAFSVDGRNMAIGNSSGDLLVLDTSTFETLGKIEISGPISDLAFSLNRGHIAVTVDHAVKVFDCSSPNKLVWEKIHRARVQDIALSPDGKVLASASEDQSIRLWNESDGKLLKEFLTNSVNVGVEFTADGQFVTSITDQGKVNVWDREGRLFQSFKACEGPVGEFELAFNDEVIIASVGTNIKVINLEAESLEHTIRAHTSPVIDIFSCDSAIYTASEDNTVRSWSRSGDQLPTTITVSEQSQSSEVRFASDNEVLCMTYDGRLLVWETDSNQQRFLPRLAGIEGKVSRFYLSPDGSKVCGKNGGLTVWDTRSGRQLFNIPTEKTSQSNEFGRLKPKVLTYLWSSLDGIFLSNEFVSTVGPWQLTSQNLTSHQLEVHQLNLYSRPSPVEADLPPPVFCCSPSGKVFAISYGEVTSLWQVAAREPKKLCAKVDLIRFDQESSLLATFSRNSSAITVWGAASGERKSEHFSVEADIVDFQFLPKQQAILILQKDGKLVSWNWNSDQQPEQVVQSKSSVTGMAVNKTGQLIAVATENSTIELYNIGGEWIGETDLPLRNCRFEAIAIVDNGNRLVGLTKSTIYIWDSATGKRVKSFPVSQSDALEQKVPQEFQKELVRLAAQDKQKKSKQRTAEEKQRFLRDALTNSYLQNTAFEKHLASTADGSKKAYVVYPKRSTLDNEPQTVEVFVNGMLVGKSKGDICSSQISSNGEFVAIATTSKGLKIFDVSKPGQPVDIRVSSEVTTIQFTANAESIVTGHRNGCVEFRDVLTGQRLLKLDAYKQAVLDLSLSDETSKLATLDTTGEIKIWNANGNGR